MYYIYIYIYCIIVYFQVLKFLYKPSFTILCPSLKYAGIFFQKELPKKLFMGETFGENLWRGVHGGTNDQIIGAAKCIFQ